MKRFIRHFFSIFSLGTATLVFGGCAHTSMVTPTYRLHIPNGYVEVNVQIADSIVCPYVHIVDSIPKGKAAVVRVNDSLGVIDVQATDCFKLPGSGATPAPSIPDTVHAVTGR